MSQLCLCCILILIAFNKAEDFMPTEQSVSYLFIAYSQLYQMVTPQTYSVTATLAYLNTV